MKLKVEFPKNFISIILILLASTSNSLKAQESPTAEIPKATEIAIPASPAFQMLDATSSLVTTPGAIRDFKVDWSFKTYRLAPNLSIEAQPIWSCFYNKPTVEKYQRASGFMRMLTTLSISAASLDFNDSIRLFSFAGKMTIYRGYDPLRNKDGFQDLQSDFIYQKALLDSEYSDLRRQYALAEKREQRDSLEQLVFEKLDLIDQLKISQKQRLQERKEMLQSKYWNATNIDIAAGKAYSFNRFFSERIDSIKMIPRSIAIWVNAGIGLGRRWLITTQIRHESIDVSLPDSGKIVVQDMFIDPSTSDTTFGSHDSLFVNFNSVTKSIMSLGINFRYGSPRYNFFVEAFYTKDRTPTFTETKWADNSKDYGAGGKLKTSTIRELYLVAFGGEWRISNNVMLGYGIRTVLDKNLVFRQMLPVVSLTCLMR